jgi:hypothetical protein
MLRVPTGKLVIAEFVGPLQVQSVATISPGNYRACCIKDVEAESRHAFLEDEYPAGDGPDFKFILERQVN